MINLKPVLSEEERKRIQKIQNTPFIELEEKEMYQGIKAQRKELSLPEAKFSPENYKSYNNLILNKPKAGSPGDSVMYSGVGSTSESPTVLNTEASKKALETQKKITSKAASVFAGVAESTLKPASKGTQYLGYIDDLVHYKKMQLTDKILGTDTADFAKDRLEDRNIKRKLFLGVQDGLIPNLNTFEENRRQELNKLAPDEKRKAESYLESVRPYVTAYEVIGGVATGVGTASVLSKAIKGATKAPPLVKATLQVLDKTINPTLGNQAKFGALMGASALLYYGATGDWIFEDDKQAEEGLMMGGFAMGLKGLGLGAKATKEMVGYLSKNPEVMGAVEKVLDDTARKLGVKTSLLPDIGTGIDGKIAPKVLSREEKNIVYKSFQELEIQQMIKGGGKYGDELGMDGLDINLFKDSEGFTPKTENMAILRKYGLMDDKGIYNFDNINTNFKDFKKAFPNLGKGLHQPVIKTSKNNIPKVNTPKVKTPVVDEVSVDTFINKKNTKAQISFEEKVKKEGLWKPEWDENGMSFTDKLSYRASDLYSLYANNTPGRIAKLFGKNKEAARDIIKSVSEMGRVSEVTSRFNTIVKSLGDDAEDFAKYIWAKQRGIKADGYFKEFGEELETSADGIKLGRGELGEIVKRYESGLKSGTYSKFAEDVKQMNRVMLNYEVEAGMRSQKEADRLFNQNPFYVKDKLLEEIEENWRKAKYSKGGGGGGGNKKSLKGGTSDYDYDIETFDNIYNGFAKRTLFAAKNQRKLDALRLFEKLNPKGATGVRILKKGETAVAKNGEVLGDMFINGQKIEVAFNKKYIEYINAGYGLGKSIESKVIGMMVSAPSNLLKTITTGKLAPVHTASMVIPDFFNGFNFALANKLNLTDYAQSYFNYLTGGKIAKNSFQSNPELKKAMLQLAKITGADFSYSRSIKTEVSADDLGIRKLAKTKWTQASEFMDDWQHNIEMGTLRIPLIEAGLKKAGLTPDKFKKIVDEANDLGVDIFTQLKRNGIDAAKVGGVARDVFDYTDASGYLRKIARVLPFVNIGAVTVESFARLLKRNPEKAAMLMVGYIGMSQIMYLNNFRGEKGDLLRKQPNYRTHQAGLVVRGDGDEIIQIRLRNIPPLDWVYPLVVELNESLFRGDENRDFSMSKAFSKMTKDVTYGIDLEGGVKPTLSNYILPFYKEAIGAIANYDFFYQSQIISQYKARPGYELSEVDKNTKWYYKKAALAYSAVATKLAQLSGQDVSDLTLDENGIYTGGIQISPKKLQYAFTPIDIFQKRTIGTVDSAFITGERAIEAMFTKEDFNETDLKRMISLFGKVIEPKTMESEIYDFMNKDRDSLGETIKDKLKENIYALPKDELNEFIKEEWEKNDGKYKEYIKDKFKDREKIDKYGKDSFALSTRPSDEIARYLVDTQRAGKKDEFNSLFKKLHGGLVGDKKYSNILKAYKELSNSK